MSEERIEEIAALVCATADTISRSLGWTENVRSGN